MKSLLAFISTFAHQGSLYRLTTDPVTLRDLGGNERTEYFSRKACDVYICRCDSGMMASLSWLFSWTWLGLHPKEARIVGRILWKNCIYDYVHIVAYEPDFKASLEIRKQNGQKIHIYEPTGEYRLDHRVFSWNSARKAWEPAD